MTRAPTQCRIGAYAGRLWYADRIGQVHLGRPPREVIAAVLDDPTVTLDRHALRRLGLLPCDLRSDERQLADLNATLDEPADQVIAPLPSATADEDFATVVGIATGLALSAFLWAALALWVAA